MAPPDDRGLPGHLDPAHPLHHLGYAKPSTVRRFTRLDGDAAGEGIAPVAEEVPVALVYNQSPHVVMMATPQDLEDFGRGFTVTEGIAARDQLRGVRAVPHARGIDLEIEIDPAAAERLKERRRGLVGRTGCGLCGVESIEEALRALAPVHTTMRVTPQALWRAERELSEDQPLNRDLATLHAAAWARPDGALEFVREDVGRHNALDKVIGAALAAGVEPAEGFLVVTSRASYELVQKAAAAGVPLLAAVSRATGLAVRAADATGVTLVALLRDGTANVYTHHERIARKP